MDSSQLFLMQQCFKKTDIGLRDSKYVENSLPMKYILFGKICISLMCLLSRKVLHTARIIRNN